MMLIWYHSRMFSNNYPPLALNHLKQWWFTHSKTNSSLSINYVTECDSTNAQLYNTTLHHNTLLVTEQQTKGKGQFERIWASQQGDLTFSIGLLLPLDKLHCLSLQVGFALAKLLKRQGLPIQLKWPNDVMARHPKTAGIGKLAGILIQSQASKIDGAAWVVIGVGLNIAARRPLKNTIQPIGLAQLSNIWNQPNVGEREKLLMQLVESIFLLTEGSAANDFTEQWNQNDLWYNHFICFTDPQGTEHHGVSLGINHDGGYQLKMKDGSIKVFHSGQLGPIKEHQ